MLQLDVGYNVSLVITYMGRKSPKHSATGWFSHKLLVQQWRALDSHETFSGPSTSQNKVEIGREIVKYCFPSRLDAVWIMMEDPFKIFPKEVGGGALSRSLAQR